MSEDRVPQWCVDARARLEACAREALEKLHADTLCLPPREIEFVGSDPADLAENARDPECGEWGRDARMANLRAVARMEFRLTGSSGRHAWVGVSVVEVENGEAPRVSFGPIRLESITARMVAGAVGDWPSLRSRAPERQA